MGKETISRRQALRRMLAVTGAAIITPSLLGFGNQLLGRDVAGAAAAMPAEVGEDHFFIKRLALALGKRTPAAKGGAPEVPYRSNYEIYSVQNNKPQLKGGVTITRGIGGDPNRMNIEVVRTGTQGHDQYIRIEETLREGVTSSPVSWTYDARLATGPDAQPLYGVPVRGQGRVDGSVATITGAGGRIRKQLRTVNPDLTLSWNMIDVVRRVAARGGSDLPLRFDTVNEYDMYGGPKTLSLYKPAHLEFAGRNRRLQSYLLRGEGVIPTFYWLDEAGELLFVNSGLEVLILV